jgi:PadR family transcriptional regulator, regulatory protein PadR
VARAEVKSANKMLRDFFLGFIKIHVLHHASKGPLYGLSVLEELPRHGYEVSPGTIYPLLHGLEADGYLDREDRLVEGKVRKYYRITPLGTSALKEARLKIGELIDEIAEDGGSTIRRREVVPLGRQVRLDDERVQVEDRTAREATHRL